MAGPYYVRSANGSSGDGLSWVNAYVTWDEAITAAAAGEIIYIDDDHTETFTSSQTRTFAGTANNPVRNIVAITDTTNAISGYGATKAFSSSGGFYDLTISGSAYFWGVHIEIADDLIVNTSAHLFFEKSKIHISHTTNPSVVIAALGKNFVSLVDTDFEFTVAVGHFDIDSGSYGLVWRGGTLTGNQTKLIDLLGSNIGEGLTIELSGIDMSEMEGGDIINNAVSDLSPQITMKGIKLNASPPDLFSGSNLGKFGFILMDIADNGNTVYKFRREYQYGYAQDETIKVITGKALYDGTNEFTAKMVSRATPTATFYDPWRYHLTTLRETGFAASRTYTVHIAQDHADTQPDALNDDEIWLEVVYPDDSTAQYNIKTDKIATPTTTPAAQTTSTESWAGLDTETRLQELSVQIDAADGKNGPVEIWVCLAKESITAYVCPEVYVS